MEKSQRQIYMNNIETKKEAIKSWLGQGSINIFGMPLAGKDTQCQLLAEWLDAPIIGGGDILRGRSDIPKRVLDIMHEGKLVPREDYIRIVTPYFSKQEFAGRPLILSAVGRYKGEETSVFDAAQQAGHPMCAVIELDLDQDLAKRRHRQIQSQPSRGQRVDDHHDKLPVRFSEFETKTRPVLNFYRRRSLLLRIDGQGTPDEVQHTIVNMLHEYLSDRQN